jgi:hypothetical protein
MMMISIGFHRAFQSLNIHDVFFLSMVLVIARPLNVSSARRYIDEQAILSCQYRILITIEIRMKEMCLCQQQEIIDVPTIEAAMMEQISMIM